MRCYLRPWIQESLIGSVRHALCLTVVHCSSPTPSFPLLVLLFWVSYCRTDSSLLTAEIRTCIKQNTMNRPLLGHSPLCSHSTQSINFNPKNLYTHNHFSIRLKRFQEQLNVCKRTKVPLIVVFKTPTQQQKKKDNLMLL